MAKHILIALTNAVEGRDDEFNAWYNNIHLSDVLKVDGFVSAQRFQLSDAQRQADPAYRYLAVYEIETDDIGKAVSDLAYQADNVMELSDAFDRKRTAMVFTPITERVTRD